ncbi:MAG: hypothetical protein IT257_02895 [Chitinophagaceae bacterium]|nr:hypothetical protein [Chitinophagaceae bacterium]
MKTIFMMLLLLPVIQRGYAQNRNLTSEKFERNNGIEVNAGGHGIFYSFGYERYLLNTKKLKLTAKCNMAYYPPKLDLARTLWIPITVNGIYSFGKHHAELGAGLMLAKDHLNLNFKMQNTIDGDAQIFPVFSAGYRYQKPAGRYYYKVMFTPVMEYSETFSDFYPLGGLTFGYTF